MKRIIVILFCVFSISNWSCQNNKVDSYKIGAIIPLTGRFAEMSLPIKNAMDIAVEDINKLGGVNGKKFEIIYGDSKGEPKIGVNETQRMINFEGIRIITTFLTGVSEAVKPITEENNILLLAQTVSPTIVDNSKNIVRFHYSFIEEGKKLANLIISNDGKNVAYIQSNDPSGSYRMENVIKPMLQEKSINITQFKYNVGTKDLSGVVLKAINNKSDILCVDGYGMDIANIIKELNKYNLESLLLVGNIGFVELPEGTQEEYYQNFIFTIPPYLTIENKKLNEFRKKYTEKTGASNIGYTAYYAYDMVYCIYKQLLKDSNIDNLKKLLIGDFEGISGNYKILESGEVITSVGLAKYQGKTITSYNEE